MKTKFLFLLTLLSLCFIGAEADNNRRDGFIPNNDKLQPGQPLALLLPVNAYRWQGPNCENTRSHMNIPNVLLNPQSFTAELWVKPTPGAINYNFSILKTNCFELLTKGNGEVMFSLRWGTAYPEFIGGPVGYNLQVNTWTHIAISMNPNPATGAPQLRIQFAKASEIANPPAEMLFPKVVGFPINSDSSTSCQLGCGSQLPFCGQIAEFRVWNTSRTQAQINALLCKRLSSSEYRNLKCYLPLNENLNNLATNGTAVVASALTQVSASDLPNCSSTIFEVSVAASNLAQSRSRAFIDVGPDTKITAANKIRIGDASVAGDPIFQYVFGFEIPVAPSGGMASSVALSFNYESANHTVGSITHNADLWLMGIGQADINPFAIWYLGDATVPVGTAQQGATLVQNDILIPNSPIGLVNVHVAGNNVVKLALNNFYTQNPTYSGGRFIYFRINCDRAPNDSNPTLDITSGYEINTFGNANPPKLKVTVE